MKGAPKEQQSNITPDGTIVFNQKGKILEIDDPAQRITGFTAKEWRGKQILGLFIIEKTGREYLDLIFNHGDAIFNLSIKIRCSPLRNENEQMLILGSLIPINKPGKKPKKALLVFRNTKSMATLMQSYDALNREWATGRVEQAIWFENADTPFFKIDTNGNMLKMNQAFFDFTDADEDITEGYRLDSFFKLDNDNEETILNALISHNWIDESLTLDVQSGKTKKTAL